MQILLDTTVLIDALRGKPVVERLRELRSSQDVPWVCAVNIEEIMRGARLEREEPVMRFLNGLQLAPLGRAEGECAGRWRREYAHKGITLHQADCLIAATAIGIGARLATGNPKHFPMPELKVEHWPVGA